MPIEVFTQTQAQWNGFRRRLDLVPPREWPRKIYRVMKHHAWPWYCRSLRLQFRLRNAFTGDKPIAIRLGSTSFWMIPAGQSAFEYWAGLRDERSELAFVLRWVRPGMIFFDVGANAGLFSLAVAAALQNRQETIYAFEPCEGAATLLERNLRINGFGGVRLVRAALCDYEGSGTLQINASLNEALDSFLARHGVERVDLLKVAVAGAERLVFRGAPQLLNRQDAPMIVCTSYTSRTAAFGYHPVEIWWQLEHYGYDLFAFDPRTSRVRRRAAGEGYDAMVVAIKPSDLRYAEFQEELR